MRSLIASLQFLYQCCFFWYVGQAGVYWTRAGWAVGSACLANLAANFLGIGGTRSHIGLTISAVLLPMIVPSFGVCCIVMPADLWQPWW